MLLITHPRPVNLTMPSGRDDGQALQIPDAPTRAYLDGLLNLKPRSIKMPRPNVITESLSEELFARPRANVLTVIGPLPDMPAARPVPPVSIILPSQPTK